MTSLKFMLWLTLLVYGTFAQSKNQPRSIVGAEIKAQWSILEFGFATPQDRQHAINNGNLVPENGTPIDVDVQYYANGQQRVFTTIPSFGGGLPYTLATVSSTGVLQPYPNFSWHDSFGTNCDQITSVFRIAINECNQMWVLDSGVIGNQQRCAPQLLLFDLNTDQLLSRYRFSQNLYIPRASLLINPLVVVQDPPPRGRCSNTMIYIADVTNHGLVVYDHSRRVAWRAEHKFMYPDPNVGTHTIAGESFTLMDGIFGLSNDKQNLYFHPLASTSEYSVPLSVVNNSMNWINSMTANENKFRALGKRNSECAASAMDSRGNQFCVTFNPIKLIVWNNKTPYDTSNFIVLPENPNYLEFVSGMKVKRNLAGKEELWMTSNRFQKIAAGTMNSNEINFRIMRRPLDDLLI